MKNFLLSILLISNVALWGCIKKAEPIDPNERLILVCEPYDIMMKRQVEQFISLYPENIVEVHTSTTREAIVCLLNDSINSIVVDRKFNEEENIVAQQASIKINENIIAKDGIAIIVHKKNPIPDLSIDLVKRIAKREIKEWKQVPKSALAGAIDFTVVERNSGMYELIQKKILGDEKKIEATTILKTQQDVIKYVTKNLLSIGFVAASQVIKLHEAVKIIPITIKTEEGEVKYLPGPQEIQQSLYPFRYSLYLYYTEAKAPSGVGFGAFVLSNVGQTIVQKADMVPVSIPYRTIQLKTE